MINKSTYQLMSVMSIQSASMICMNGVSRHKVDYPQAHRDYFTLRSYRD